MKRYTHKGQVHRSRRVKLACYMRSQVHRDQINTNRKHQAVLPYESQIHRCSAGLPYVRSQVHRPCPQTDKRKRVRLACHMRTRSTEAKSQKQKEQAGLPYMRRQAHIGRVQRSRRVRLACHMKEEPGTKNKNAGVGRNDQNQKDECLRKTQKPRSICEHWRLSLDMVGNKHYLP